MGNRVATQMLLASILGLSAGMDMASPLSGGYAPSGGHGNNPTKKQEKKSHKKAKRKMAKASKKKNRR